MFRARDAGELLPRFNAAERKWQQTLARMQAMQAMGDPVDRAWRRFITAHPEYAHRDLRQPLTDSPEDQKFRAAVEWFEAREAGDYIEQAPGEWISKLANGERDA